MTTLSKAADLGTESTMLTLGYQLMPYPDRLKKATDELAEAQKEWFAQPQAEKDKFKFSIKGGYEGPYSKSERVDFKETFHYTIAFADKLHRHTLTDADKKMLRAAYKVMHLMRSNIREFIQMVERTSGFKLMKRVMKNFKIWTLRLLNYFPGKKPELAAPHPDKGFMTAVIHQSEEGHQNLSLDRSEWRDMHAGKENILMFSGLIMQLLTGCVFKGLCHRVIANKNSMKYGRQSAVLFVDIRGIYLNKYPNGMDKPKVNSQTLFPNGDNYLYDPNGPLPPEEFNKFFTSKPSE